MKTWIKVLFALLLIGLITGALLYVFVYNKPHRDIAKAKPDLSVTAAELFDAFRADEVSAGARFNGKVVQIEGVVDDIDILDDLVIMIFVFDDGIFGQEGVRCNMLPDWGARALEFQVGDFITIKGLCTGYTSVDVILEKCSVVAQ
jgi:hypothetical protein